MPSNHHLHIHLFKQRTKIISLLFRPFYFQFLQLSFSFLHGNYGEVILPVLLCVYTSCTYVFKIKPIPNLEFTLRYSRRTRFPVIKGLHQLVSFWLSTIMFSINCYKKNGRNLHLADTGKAMSLAVLGPLKCGPTFLLKVVSEVDESFFQKECSIIS